MLELIGSFTGKIATGQYQNASPFYSVKETTDKVMTDEEIKTRIDQLNKICLSCYERDEELFMAKSIIKEYQNIRFYDVESMKLPSVTSICNWDIDFQISQDELAQYGARGTIIHKQVELFLKNGEWKLPKDIPEIYPELVILSKGNLGLVVEDVDFQGFFKEYPFKVLETEKTVYNTTNKYAGRLDILCVIESKNKGKWDKVEGILFDEPMILDIKSGSIDKTKCMKQQTAYWKCLPEVKSVGLIHLNNDTKQGYSKPIIETNPDKYWTLFLKDRELFQKRFGV